MLHQLLISLGNARLLPWCILGLRRKKSVMMSISTPSRSFITSFATRGTSLQYIPSTWLISQLAVSFLLLVIGITISAPPIKNVYWKAELKQRSIDGFDSKMGFINLHTRATRIHQSSS
ncbi:hypothetical protein PSHT_14005 [Puccinia striiformis]|uniref:Uncharacterized protein n=1 Tax=Puccinia striiformis TaxID=27350 RepID=A0A2S4UMP9_9BASI|nr:hypothetical protein PSHT_14005 [Puccinia striiformis]